MPRKLSNAFGLRKEHLDFICSRELILDLDLPINFTEYDISMLIDLIVQIFYQIKEYLIFILYIGDYAGTIFLQINTLFINNFLVGETVSIFIYYRDIRIIRVISHGTCQFIHESIRLQ